MLKRIPVDSLRPGMYVHDLECSWLDHSFARNRFLIKDQATIARIRALGVESIWIDTAKSSVPADDETPAPARAAPSPPAPTSTAPPRPARSATDESRHLVQLREEAAQTVENAMERCRLGKPIELREIAPLVDDMLESLERRPHALVGLCRLRDKDRYTFEHSVSVGILTSSVGRSLGLQQHELRELALGGLLHDVGKSRTPSRILNKPGRLTENEYAVMRRHVEHGEAIAAPIEGLTPEVLNAVTQHHERLDGSGYPRGLKGEQISRAGRIIAVCDVYDAMTADRCYRAGEEPTKVMRMLLEGCDTQFDTAHVHHLIRCVGIYPIGALVSMASGRLGMVMRPGEKGLLYPVVRVFYDIGRRLHLDHHDVDLSHAADERIVGYEAAEGWDFDPELVPQLE